MTDWIKTLVVHRLVGLAIGFVISKLAATNLQAHGVTVDPTALQGSLWAAYETFNHWVDGKTAGTKWEWVGKIL